MNTSLDQLPYYASVWESEHLLGHGCVSRKLENANRILESKDFDSVYKLIASVHKQNILLTQMLDNDEDRDLSEPKKPTRKRAAPKRAPAKRVTLTKFIDISPKSQPPGSEAPDQSASTA